ncbi:hypothetical protein AAUPMC_11381 [Pasteurella multocida subsp. multocida str. Anand1_cattle]|nr:hypothetical protein AAUPMC_11381 [Pasteurella multocida subsp. multocida str. Anand1_cattle]
MVVENDQTLKMRKKSSLKKPKCVREHKKWQA